MSNESKQPLRRLAAGAVALVTSASMLAGGIFHSPADLPEEGAALPPPIVLDEDELDGDGKNKKNPPPGTVEPEPERAVEGSVPEQEVALPEEEKSGLRRWWSSLRFSQRLLVIPLAALLGWGLFTLLGALLPGLAGRLVAWLATFAALAAGFIATEKALFPDIPVRKLLRSRNFTGLLIGLTSLGAADLLLPAVWSGYSKWELLLRALGLTLVFSGAGLSFARRTRREQERREREAEALAAEAEPEPEEPRPLTREDVLAIADTVSRKRK